MPTPAQQRLLFLFLFAILLMSCSGTENKKENGAAGNTIALIEEPLPTSTTALKPIDFDSESCAYFNGFFTLLRKEHLLLHSEDDAQAIFRRMLRLTGHLFQQRYSKDDRGEQLNNLFSNAADDPNSVHTPNCALLETLLGKVKTVLPETSRGSYYFEFLLPSLFDGLDPFSSFHVDIDMTTLSDLYRKRSELDSSPAFLAGFRVRTPLAWKLKQVETLKLLTVIDVDPNNHQLQVGDQITDVWETLPTNSKKNETKISSLTYQDWMNWMKRFNKGAIKGLGLSVSGKGEIIVDAIPNPFSPFSYRFLPGGLLYLSMSSFDPNTLQSLSALLKGPLKKPLQEKRISAIIFDLRDNGGGWMCPLADLAWAFLPKEEVLVRETDKTGPEEGKPLSAITTKFQEGECIQLDKSIDPKKRILSLALSQSVFQNLPVVLLQDDRTASAAELFIQAMRDYGIGISAGTASFGKPIAQDTIRRYRVQKNGDKIFSVIIEADFSKKFIFNSWGEWIPSLRQPDLDLAIPVDQSMYDQYLKPPPSSNFFLEDTFLPLASLGQLFFYPQHYEQAVMREGPPFWPKPSDILLKEVTFASRKETRADPRIDRIRRLAEKYPFQDYLKQQCDFEKADCQLNYSIDLLLQALSND